MLEPVKILERALKKVQKMKSYRCVMALESFAGGKKEANQRYIYRAPGDIRIEQMGPFRRGAVVVIHSDGRVRAHAGGLLSFVKIDLDRNSELLKGITGESAVEGDWLSIMRRAEKMAPYVIESECRTLKKSGPFREYEVNTRLKGQPFDQVRSVIREDGPILLIERLKTGSLLTSVRWEDIEVDPPTTDKDFEL